MKSVIILVILSMVCIHFMGCAPSMTNQAQKLIEDEAYGEAMTILESLLKVKPNDPAALREMGIVHHRQGNMEESIPFLMKAFVADSTDGRTLFYLGTAFESTGRIDYAIDIYRRYGEVSLFSEVRSQIEARMTRLIQKSILEEVHSAIAEEESLDLSAIPENSVAVFSFKNLGQNRNLDPIQKGLADMVITDLSQVNRLKVIERMHMQKLTEELGLGQTGLVEEATGPRAARLLKASRFVQGSFVGLPDAGLRIDAGLIPSVAEGSIQTTSVDGKLMRLFQLEKDLVFAILDKMGIVLSQAERDAIEIIPTENLLAFMAYCRGLDYEDRGLYQEAAEQYQLALDFDSKYEKARIRQSRAQALAAPELDLTLLERQFILTSAHGTGPYQSGTGRLASYMQRAGGLMNRNFLPGIDSRKPIQEQMGSNFGNTAGIDVVVPLPENR